MVDLDYHCLPHQVAGCLWWIIFLLRLGSFLFLVHSKEKPGVTDQLQGLIDQLQGLIDQLHDSIYDTNPNFIIRNPFKLPCPFASTLIPPNSVIE